MSADSEQVELFPELADEEGAMCAAVRTAIATAPVEPRDIVGVQLVIRQAQLLDRAHGTSREATVYASLGPKLLAALSVLGWTSAGRAQAEGGAGAGSKLDELRKRRDERRRSG